MVGNFLDTLKQPGACQFGTWVKLGTPETLECLALAGFDFVAVDMEHAPHTFESAYRCIVMAQGLGMKVLVRLPDGEGAVVQRILDSGADGVLIPRVRSADEAQRIANGMLFSPTGSRGMGITSRAGSWGLKRMTDYVREGNQQVLRVPQLEDPAALQAVGDILNVPGINGIFVGPGDLSLVTGKPATDPANAALIDNLVKVAKERGIPCGTAVGDSAAALKAKAKGFNFVMVSNDVSMFAKTAQGLIQGIKG